MIQVDRLDHLVPTVESIEPPRADEATELRAAAPVNVIAFAFTSQSDVLGQHQEAKLKGCLERLIAGIPWLSACPSAVVALRAPGVQKLRWSNPPCFRAPPIAEPERLDIIVSSLSSPCSRVR